MIVPDLIESAVAAEQTLRSLSFHFCFIGGIAVQRWGEPRSTVVLDLTLLTDFGNERPFADQLLKHFAPRIRDAAQFAVLHRVLLLSDERGTPLDISFGAMPFEERTVERATPFEILPGKSITTCAATDLVIHKAFAARLQDSIDI